MLFLILIVFNLIFWSSIPPSSCDVSISCKYNFMHTQYVSRDNNILCVVYHPIWDKVLRNILISVSVIWRNGKCKDESLLTFCLFLFDSNFYPTFSIRFNCICRPIDGFHSTPAEQKGRNCSYAHHEKQTEEEERNE